MTVHDVRPRPDTGLRIVILTLLAGMTLLPALIFGMLILTGIAFLTGFVLALFVSKNAVVDWRHTFSPTLLNTFRVGWLTVSGGQANQNSDVNFPAQAGLQGINPDPRDLGYQFFNLSGEFSPFGRRRPFKQRF